MNEQEIRSLWRELPFSTFSDYKKIEEWKKYALDILANLANGNTGLVADTGTGKTIMAFLVHEALGLRTLFVTPTVFLTEQHADLYRNVTGKEAVTIHGQKTKRDWIKGQLVIATPHVFMADFKKGLVNANLFDLLIVDELHKAEGEYPYVPIANKFAHLEKEILCLSASPGSDYDSIQYIEGVYNIKNWVVAEINKPDTKYHLVKANLSPELEEAATYFKSEYVQTLIKLKKVFTDSNQEIIFPINENNPFLTQRQNNLLDKEVNSLSKPAFYEAKLLFSRQYKLAYLFRVLMTENYASFINQVYKVLVSSETKAAKTIVNNLGFRKIYWKIKKIDSSSHPKEAELLKLMKELTEEQKSCLVFVSSKRLGTDLSLWFNSMGYESDTLFGKTSKSLKKQLEVIEKFRQREIKIIFATSVVEEGLSLPEIDVVIHYNQPMTEIARLQRDGRTGRFSEGSVYFLITDIPYENALYYATLSKLHSMREIFYKKPEFSEPQKISLKRKNRKKEVRLSGQLTIDWGV